MELLNDWATKHNISAAALADLRASLVARYERLPETRKPIVTESDASNACRLDASRHGARLWRNNVGAFMDEGGNLRRYGLANDSKKMNSVFKSSDLIGINPITVTEDMVGGVIGQFVAREVKRPGWNYSGNEHEAAQLAFLEFIRANGGDACFTCGAY